MDFKDYMHQFKATRGGIRFPVPYRRNDIVIYTAYSEEKYVGVVLGMGEGWLMDMVKVIFWNEEKNGFLEETGVDPHRLEIIGSLADAGVSLDG